MLTLAKNFSREPSFVSDNILFRTLHSRRATSERTARLLFISQGEIVSSTENAMTSDIYICVTDCGGIVMVSPEGNRKFRKRKHRRWRTFRYSVYIVRNRTVIRSPTASPSRTSENLSNSYLAVVSDGEIDRR